MAKNTYNLRRSRMNPVGSDSYIDSVLDRAKLNDIRGVDGFPSQYGGARGPRTPEGYPGRWVEDKSLPGTAVKPAAATYANRIFRVRNLDTTYFPRTEGGPAHPPARLKGGLSSYLDGWSKEDEDLERLQTLYSGHYRVTPRLKARAGKGETTVDFWSGGFDALKKLGASWLTDPADETYVFGNLAPWQPDNQQGTGIWRDIGAQILNGTVRGDEAFAAAYILREDISPMLRAYTRGAVTADKLKAVLAQGISGILNVIYGSDLKEDVDLANERGIARLKADAAAVEGRAATRQAGASPTAGAPATSSAHRAALAARRTQGAAAAPPPAPAAAPEPTQAEVQAAAAAVTAPVTPAAPAAAVHSDAIQKLLNLGIELAEAQQIMALPPAKRVSMMLVLLGN
jgi:hypothetical protein